MGTGIPEVHPRFRTQRCTKSGGCKTQQTYLVADARHRAFHNTEGAIVKCSAANKVLCLDEATCAKNCILNGVEYGSLGMLASDTAVTLRNYLFDGKKHRTISPRVYLLAEDGEDYEPIKLPVKPINQLSGKPGFLRRLLQQNGHLGSQLACHDHDFASLQANGPFLCNGDQCDELEKSGSGMRARKGCGINPFRLGAPEFYGKDQEHKVDTSRPFTVVTRFFTDDNSTTGALTEIRRVYIQDGKTFPATYSSNIKALNHANTSPSGGKFEAALTEGYCSARGFDDHVRLDGLKTMGQALGRGMIMVLSIWNSERDSMAWLDAGKKRAMPGR
ncbi:glycoside hydrolase family 7 protein [Neurospora crassa]|uniref:Glucanase n=2 Tax=Neurospora crassa TaxID=5141 RepID=Q7RZI8_NEUCR|nr:endoglucanase EG-1 [Neurospora crassa OR74A]EAA28406.2 endoglucanase EG-1 [Neurospora crassa OR74A]KHE86226.1 glycoside hydrolase family 7 protein [Neurospora crassa]|eukprot:XP_957642.2 endoglucanase EG-1 [Neurospora crassa OR74A]